MNILEIYPELKNFLIFRSAKNENICLYITEGSFSERIFSAGEDIASPDVKNVPVGLILDGRASVSSADDGKRVLLRTVGTGAVFGIATLYSDDSPFPTKINAISRCRVLFIERTAVCALIQNDGSANRDFLTFLSNRIVYLNKKINAFTAGNAERRLSLFLADNETNGVYSSDISMVALADMLDIGRASLYRAFDRLTKDGLIEKKDKVIIIKDKDAMIEKYFS